MSADTFVLARRAVSVPLIEQMFGREGSRWEGDEYKTLSPLRADAHTGSFAIKRDGSLIAERAVRPGRYRLSIAGRQPDARSASLSGAAVLDADLEITGAAFPIRG
jgi:hypothetical protein